MVFLATLAVQMSERLTWVLKIKFNVFNVVIVGWEGGENVLI